MKYDNVVYYNNESEDEFSGIKRPPKNIPDDYKYVNRNPLWRALSAFVYRGIMTPVAYFYCKLKFGMKRVGAEALRPYRKSGFFMYGNHTQVPGDGYIQALAAFPTRSYVIVNPDSVALRGTEQFMLMIGAMPLPSGLRGLGNLERAVEWRIGAGNAVAIYPEAHIWPYYTGIRPFGETSFAYPVRLGVPCFSFTVVYRKRKHRKTPGITVYIDGPFFPDEDLKKRERIKALRDAVYGKMCERSRLSDCEYIKYVKRSGE